MKLNRFGSKDLIPCSELWKESLIEAIGHVPVQLRVKRASYQARPVMTHCTHTQKKVSLSLKLLPVCPRRRIQLKPLNSRDCSCFNWITKEMAAGCDAHRARCHRSFTPQDREKRHPCVRTLWSRCPLKRQSHQSELPGFTCPLTWC